MFFSLFFLNSYATVFTTAKVVHMIEWLNTHSKRCSTAVSGAVSAFRVNGTAT